MKIYKTQQEVEADIKNDILLIEGDVRFECSIAISVSIVVNAGDINAVDINAWDINAGNINAGNINAVDINAWDINAGNIKALDINAGNIKAEDINAWDINARDINAVDIKAVDINAWDINYYAFCCAYQSITCTSIKANRIKASEPICLDGKLTIKKSNT